MTATSPFTAPVLWSEGMLLTPQHFQQNDIYWHHQLHQMMARLQPFFWGVLHLEIDQSQLLEGTLQINALSCVMPDGLPVTHPVPYEKRPPLRLEGLKALESGKSLKVHLTLPKRIDDAGNNPENIRRYDPISGGLVADENSGDGRVEIHRLLPRIELRRADEVSAYQTHFPLLEIRRDESGVIGLTRFHPPMLTQQASAFLGPRGLERRLKLLVDDIRTKIHDLAGGNKEEGRANGIPPTYRRMIQALAGGLPALEVMVKNRASHPYPIYLELARMVGALASVTSSPIPLLPEAYRHDDAYPGFDKMLSAFEGVLKGIRMGYTLKSFDDLGGGTLACELKENWALEDVLIELRTREGCGAEELLQWLRSARIGTEDALPLIRERRVTGAEPRRMPGGGVAKFLPLREGSVLIKLENVELDDDGAKRSAITAGETLRIEGGDDRARPLAAMLYHLKRTSDASAVNPQSD